MNSRIIITNVPATSINGEIMRAVIGQMSDGIWENSRRMESIWRGLETGTQNGYETINVDTRSDLYYKSDDEVCEYFANKIKQIIKEEIKDGCKGMVWDRACKTPSVYLNYYHDVQVRDAYFVYDTLKGRVSKTKPPVETLVQNINKLDRIEGKGIVSDIQPVQFDNSTYYIIKFDWNTVEIYKAGKTFRKRVN